MICVNCAALKAENAALRDDIAKLSAEYERAMRVVEAASTLAKHWKEEYAHFACGGEAQLIEALETARSAE